MNKSIILGLVFLVSLVSVNAFYDHATNVYYDGELVQSGNLRILIYETAEGGSPIYDETFNGVINNGMWSVYVDADLVYGKTYFKDYEVNGQNIDFGGVERLAFVSRQGVIDASNITSGVFDVDRIPELDASKITSGNLNINRMPEQGTWSLSNFINIVGGWLQINNEDVLTNTSYISLVDYVDETNISMKSYVDTLGIDLESQTLFINDSLYIMLNDTNTSMRLYVDNLNTSLYSYIDFSNDSMRDYVDGRVLRTGDTMTGKLTVGDDLDVIGNLDVSGTVVGSNLNVEDWDTAYGWGDHSVEGYLTSISGGTGISVSGTTINLDTPVSVAHGGTGATDAVNARSNLGITPGNIGALANTHAASGVTTAKISNWDSAHVERGSQIAGTGLGWSGGNLNVQAQYIRDVVNNCNVECRVRLQHYVYYQPGGSGTEYIIASYTAGYSSWTSGACSRDTGYNPWWDGGWSCSGGRCGIRNIIHVQVRMAC